jgi:putative OmpL-like beta-barrel porin-2
VDVSKSLTTSLLLFASMLPASLAQAQTQYGAFLDAGYLYDRNRPSNHVFRSRGTTWHVDEWDVNMAGVSLKKKPSAQSRWAEEVIVHAGKDAELFGFSVTAPNIAGATTLRHFGLANVSYLAPAGRGLTLQGGIFNSFIGYDSLYAKDNFTYTRPWGADFTPYLMLGVNASYPFTGKLTGTALVLNGYWHLANANHVPSTGGQLAYAVNPRVTVKETVLWGPHQSSTTLQYWRFLSDSIVERKTDSVTVAAEYQVAAERVDVQGNPRALWMSGQLPVHWQIRGPWSVTLRPEVAWDRDGRWTLARQTVKAMTATLEYRLPLRTTTTIVRLEHRVDDSRGPQGGFFRDGQTGSDPGLQPTQHLLILGLMINLDSRR